MLGIIEKNLRMVHRVYRFT